MQEIYDLVEQRGWYGETLYALALAFIAKNMLESEFLGFCLEAVEEGPGEKVVIPVPNVEQWDY